MRFLHLSHPPTEESLYCCLRYFLWNFWRASCRFEANFEFPSLDGFESWHHSDTKKDGGWHVHDIRPQKCQKVPTKKQEFLQNHRCSSYFIPISNALWHLVHQQAKTDPSSSAAAGSSSWLLQQHVPFWVSDRLVLDSPDSSLHHSERGCLQSRDLLWLFAALPWRLCCAWDWWHRGKIGGLSRDNDG